MRCEGDLLFEFFIFSLNIKVEKAWTPASSSWLCFRSYEVLANNDRYDRRQQISHHALPWTNSTRSVFVCPGQRYVMNAKSTGLHMSVSDVNYVKTTRAMLVGRVLCTLFASLNCTAFTVQMHPQDVKCINLIFKIEFKGFLLFVCLFSIILLAFSSNYMWKIAELTLRSNIFQLPIWVYKYILYLVSMHHYIVVIIKQIA